VRLQVPKFLGEEGKKEWKRIYKVLMDEDKDFTDKDIKLLELYCKNYEKWLQAEEFIIQNGSSYICQTGYPSQYPEVNISNNSQKNMLSYMKELGLTPAARSRMNKNNSSGSGNNDDDEMEDMIAK